MNIIAKQVAHYSMSEKHKIDKACNIPFSEGYNSLRYYILSRFLAVHVTGINVCKTVHDIVNFYDALSTLLNNYDKVSHVLNKYRHGDKNQLVYEMGEIIDNTEINMNALRIAIERFR